MKILQPFEYSRLFGLKSLEASTGIEPVYTDLQSAASPLRQLAIRGVKTNSVCSRVSDP